MSKHTPGPWFVGRMLSPNAPAIIGDGDTVLAIMPGAWNGCSPHVEDARLIAAAPELLDALKQWKWAELNGDMDELDNARVSRDIAIAKATGECDE